MHLPNRMETTPFPHAIAKNFLPEKEAKALRKALLVEIFERKESDLFCMAQTKELVDSDNKTITDFLHKLRGKEFLGTLSKLTGQRLNGEISAFGAIYGDADYLLCHDDELEDRKIAWILNLSEGFTEKSGGALALLDATKNGGPNKVVQRILPEWNTLSFFVVSTKSHHMVEEVLEEKQRLTIGGWFHG